MVTPKTFNLMAYADADEPMRYIIRKHAQNSQVFLVGCSMGANILGHVLGNEGMKSSMNIDAAVVIQSPMNLLECQKNVRLNVIQKAYDMGLSMNLIKVLKR